MISRALELNIYIADRRLNDLMLFAFYATRNGA